MPGGDGTGPMGMGAMAGREAGYCAGYSIPGYMNPVVSRGFRRRQGGQVGFGWGRGAGRGRGRAMGFGRRRWAVPFYGDAPYLSKAVGSYGVAPTREQELEMLKSQAEDFQDAMQDIQKRISELEIKSENKK